MTVVIILFLVGFILISKGADIFIDCTVKIGKKTGISELILGISLSSIFYFNYSPTLYILVIFLFVMSYFDRIYKNLLQQYQR